MHIIRPVGLELLSASEPEDDAPEWSVATTYNQGDQVIRGGNLYVSSINGNVGIDPALEVQELEGVRWVFIAATNIRRFLDGRPSTKTEGTSPLVLEVTASAHFSAVALIGLSGSETTVEVLSGGTVTDSRVIKSGFEIVDNWWDWLNTTFYSVSRRKVLSGLAGFSGATIRVTITGDSPALGLLVAGRSVKIGKTLMNDHTKVRRRTFTTIETNAFGITEATKRAVARDVTYSIDSERQGFSGVERILDDVDGVPVVTFAAANGFDELINYGFILNSEIPSNLPHNFLFQINTQGVS